LGGAQERSALKLPQNPAGFDCRQPAGAAALAAVVLSILGQTGTSVFAAPPVAVNMSAMLLLGPSTA
jgi:hypothetical protein